VSALVIPSEQPGRTRGSAPTNCAPDIILSKAKDLLEE